MSHNSKTIPQINFVITNDIKNYLKSKFLALNLLTLFLLKLLIKGPKKQAFFSLKKKDCFILA